MFAVGLIFILFSVLFIVVGALAATRKLPGNNIIGLRVDEVRKSREIWDVAHAVAGPIWILGGVALAFGGIVAFSATGWMWTIPLVTAIIAVLALSVGANLGAKAAFLQDAKTEDSGCGDGGCNCGSGGCGGEVAAPEVNVDALRQAARSADEK